MPVADLGPGRLRLHFRAGDRVVLPITYKEDGVATSLAGHTLTADIRRRVTDPTPTVSFSIDMTDAATGEITLEIPAASTVGLAGRYRWHLTDETADRTLLADVCDVDRDSP